MNLRPRIWFHIRKQFQIIYLDVLHIQVVQILKMTLQPHLVTTCKFVLHDILDEINDLLQIKVTEDRQIVGAVVGNFQNVGILITQIMRHHNKPVLIHNWNRFLAIMADDIIDFGSREFVLEIGNRLVKLIQLWEGRRGEHHIWNQVLSPILLDNLVEFVLLVIHCYGRFIPINNQFLVAVERFHIIHRRQVRLDVANHNFHIIPHTVIHLENTSSSCVLDKLLRGEVVQSNIRCGSAPKCKCNLLLGGNCRLCQSNSDMSGSTHKDNSVGLR